VLCWTLGLLALYNVPICRYFITLYWVWYLYHNYVGEVTWCNIFWWFYWSLNSSSRNFFCFFKRAQPLFWTTTPTFLGCWALIAPTFFTCFQQDDRPILLNVVTHVENRHFPIPNGIRRCPNHVTPRCLLSCPTFWKPNGSIIPLVIGCFGGSLTQTRVYFPYSIHSFRYCASTFLLMCRSKGMHLVINLSCHTNISSIIDPPFYNITYSSWLATFYSCPPFMVLMWSYHWQSRYPFALMPLWEWMYSSPQHILGYYCN